MGMEMYNNPKEKKKKHFIIFHDQIIAERCKECHLIEKDVIFLKK